MAIKQIPLTAKQREQLINLGFKEEEINNQTLIDITLWKQALNGNVNALNTIRSMLDDQEDKIDEAEDITEEVEKEEKKLLEELAGLSQIQLSINSQLIHNVAFQSVQLRKLADDISKNGVKEKYKNGANQWGYKDRTEVKTYNNMFKNYQASLKQLNDLIGQKITFEDEFDEFENKY